jgi:hypothetical protein
MGKRELLIAVIFVALGALAYQATAPAPRPGEQGFSFARWFDNLHRQIHGDAAQTSVTQTGTVGVEAAQSELRLEGTLRQLRVIGEDRHDVIYEMTVQSTGPDVETARGYANETKIRQDNVGPAVGLRVTYPQGGRQAASVVLHVPSRLAMVITGVSGLEISNVASAHLDNVSGDASFIDIPGGLNGSHRGGSLKASNIGAVKLSLQRSRASFENLHGGATFEIRDGECHLASSKGDVEIDEARAGIDIRHEDGTIRVTGGDGSVSIEDPVKSVSVDVRRAEVEVSMRQAVPLTVLTTDETLRVLLDGPLGVSIDAVSRGGHVQANDFGLEPESADQESRLWHAFAENGVRVSLRNQRGDITIRNLRGAIVKPPGK